MILPNPAPPLRMAMLMPSPRRMAALGAAALAFVALYLGRSTDTIIADAIVLLFVIPVAILALEFGMRGGIAGAVAAIVLLAAWDASAAAGIAPLGYLARALAFLVLGAGIGRVAELRRHLEHDLLAARDMSLHMIATTSADGVFRSLNPAWELALGVPRATLVGRPVLDFIHPDDLVAAGAALLGVGDRDVVSFRGRIRDGRGGYRLLEWNARSQCGRGLIHVTARDLTVQCQAEELLADHAETLERLVVERTNDLDHERLQTLQRLALAAEFRDDDTKQHTDRVGSSAAAIAVELGLRPALVANIYEAAPLHDVGKIGISDAILLKPGRLNADELVEMRKHAQIGATILSGSDFAVLQLAEEIALTHHERWDGTGYPAGLAGRAIPIAGRIVAVADVFDALTHARPYKEAWPVAKALRTIRDGAGTHFDAEVVAAFERLQTPAALRAAALHVVPALAA